MQVGVGMSPGEQRSHFALWCLFKSPMLISADLRIISQEALAILKAKEVVAVNQDEMGVAGDLIWKEGPLEVSSSWLPACYLGLACSHMACNAAAGMLHVAAAGVYAVLPKPLHDNWSVVQHMACRQYRACCPWSHSVASLHKF